nr:MAG TPA: hypothetical protein [Caudoviricetes sp.]
MWATREKPNERIALKSLKSLYTRFQVRISQP